MLQDDFKKLLELFAQSNEQNVPNLEELLFKSLAFFETLKDVLKEASPEEKQGVLQMMMEMHTKIQAQMKTTCQKLNISEEELRKIAENPNNFTAEQWKFMQEAKEKILGAEANTGIEEVKPETRPEQKNKKSSSKKSHLPKKDRWMRS